MAIKKKKRKKEKKEKKTFLDTYFLVSVFRVSVCISLGQIIKYVKKGGKNHVVNDYGHFPQISCKCAD